MSESSSDSVIKVLIVDDHDLVRHGFKSLLGAQDGIEVVETILQQRSKIDSRFLMGTGKLQDLTIRALQRGATLIIFDQELNVVLYLCHL